MAKINKPTLVKPIVGASKDVWGDILNNNIDNTEKFYTQLISDLETKDAELARLEQGKAGKSELPTLVSPIVDNYMESTIKPQVETYISQKADPIITAQTEVKKQELNQHVETINKPELDEYTKAKEGELDTHTGKKKSELDAYEKAKEGQLDSHTDTKKEELNQHTVQKQGQLDEYTAAKKGELDSHTIEKKNELNTHEKAKEKELDSYVTTVNKPELDEHTNIKKQELNSHTETKESEIAQVTETKKQEITAHSASELGKFNQGAKQEANTQIGRVVAEGDVQVQRVKDESNSVISRIEKLESGKVSKSGDVISGPLVIDAENNNLKLYSKGVNKGEVVVNDDGLSVWNSTSRNRLKLYDNGNSILNANNLTTANKEVIGAINEQMSYLGKTYNSFPLTSAIQNEIYYHVGSNKMYVCTSSYSGAQLSNPNSNFEELSVYTNRQRLDNLRHFQEYLLERRGQYDEYVGMKLPLKNSYREYRFLSIETVNTSTHEYMETFISTNDLSQSNENYKYRIAGFLLKPNNNCTEFEILDLPKDGFTHLNSILGIR